MQNPIVQQSALKSADQKILHFAATHRGSFGVDFNDPDFGLAFVYYVFFSRHPSVSSVLGIDVSDEDKFYNAYYWFQRFVRLCMKKHGYDAGLEQQAFKMLEGATFDVDFGVVAMLDNKAKE